MTNRVYIWNQTPPELSLTFNQLGSPLEEGENWGVLSTTAPFENSGNPTDVMWVNNSEGIKDNLDYWWDINLTLPDGTYLFTAQPREVGDAIGSDKSISTQRTQQPDARLAAPGRRASMARRRAGLWERRTGGGECR
jgi:hypothetical protein